MRTPTFMLNARREIVLEHNRSAVEFALRIAAAQYRKDAEIVAEFPRVADNFKRQAELLDRAIEELEAL